MGGRRPAPFGGNLQAPQGRPKELAPLGGRRAAPFGGNMQAVRDPVHGNRRRQRGAPGQHLRNRRWRCGRPQSTRGPAPAPRRMRAMRYRMTAWLALLAMLSGLALPAHAYAHLARAGVPGSDLCVADPSSKSSPKRPDGEHTTAACDMCSGCADGAAASGAARDQRAAAPTDIAIAAEALFLRAGPNAGLRLPRGPPAFA